MRLRRAMSCTMFILEIKRMSSFISIPWSTTSSNHSKLKVKYFFSKIPKKCPQMIYILSLTPWEALDCVPFPFTSTRTISCQGIFQWKQQKYSKRCSVSLFHFCVTMDLTNIIIFIINLSRCVNCVTGSLSEAIVRSLWSPFSQWGDQY